MNRRVMKAVILTAALVLCGSMSVPDSYAATVKTTPSTAILDATRTNIVTIEWDASSVVASLEGRFVTTDGQELGTVNVALSTDDTFYTEDLTVTLNIINKAISMDAAEFDYERVFNFGAGVYVTSKVRLILGNLASMVEVNPSRTSVSYGTDTTVNLTWSVELLGSKKVWVESRQGNFTDKRGRLLRPPVNNLLRQAGARKVTFEETLLVPQSIVDTIASRGESLFHYTREFMVDGLALMGTLELRIEGGLQEVRPAQARHQAAAGRTSMVAVNWLARLKPGVDPAGLKITSPGGVFRTPDGMMIRRAGKPLSSTMGAKSLARRGRLKAIQPPGKVLEITENVPVPVDVVKAVIDRGHSNFLYSRVFTDGFDKVEGSVIFDLTGRIGGGFSIDRVSLYFPDKSLVKVVSPDDELHALAELSWTGSGRILAVWEIAEPTSTVGVPIFKTLSRVVKQLNVRKRIVISSPGLPTEMAGPYVIRFRIINPELGERAAVALLYQVNPPSVGALPMGPGAVQEIAIIKPLGEVPPVPGAAFAWKSVPGSIAYQLEFFDGASLTRARRVSGQVVPGKLTELSLTELTAGNLTPGMNYWWRVVAFGPGGGILGASELTPTSLQ